MTMTTADLELLENYRQEARRSLEQALKQWREDYPDLCPPFPTLELQTESKWILFNEHTSASPGSNHEKDAAMTALATKLRQDRVP